MTAEAEAFYQRTGHCSQCGQPGEFCLCTPRNPCGCKALHAMGSGIGRDAAEVFADVPVSDEQASLW